MQAQRMIFDCDKAVALGALYDATDNLKWRLLSANSETGILVVEERRAGTPFLVRACQKDRDMTEVTVELASGVFSGRDSPGVAAALLLEKVAQIIGNALSKNPRET
jgi:hypothetical protein